MDNQSDGVFTELIKQYNTIID